MPPSLARLDHTGYEHHIFSLRWPHRSYPPKNPKLDSLMKDIDAQHYALLIVYFTTEPGPLSLHGRTIELSLQDTSPKALLDDPDGKAVQVDLEHDWEDTFRNYHDGDARRCHVKYVATVQYPFEKEEWRSLEEIAMKILRRAGGLYNCERFHCQTFCENVSGEVYALAQRKKEVDEKKRDRCHVM
ncbi:hypothetical protein EJ08DRAFT_303835 [Tothia fuscella]|uniref:Uncharacterized protein n=1 Tax=Tothia fuscella TaxID=1048955 RepID=A0A9P4NPA4_9PEZI|nr:hypothetical protein EJ08DRAFT_303835 [Tothia fuscella]